MYINIKQLNLWIVFTGILLISMMSCKTTNLLNPPAQGFDAIGSDAKAIEVADKVMEAMGGRKNWDDTKILEWNFFGARKLTWNKHSGDVRITSKKDNYTVLMNIFTDKGQVMKDGEVFTQADSLEKYLTKGKNAWINDSYWLVMPFKLKDSGVQLKYVEERKIAGGNPVHILALTFKDVGTTPLNKYLVHVDTKTNLVTQWDFYNENTDPEPRFSTPWESYKPFGKILLSGSRGEKYKLTEIKVLENVPEGFFSKF